MLGGVFLDQLDGACISAEVLAASCLQVCPRWLHHGAGSVGVDGQSCVLVFFSYSLDVYQNGWIYASGHCSVNQGQWMPVCDPARFGKLKQRNGQLLLFGASGKMNRVGFYQSQEYLVFAT